jgi:hypothetical protein
LSFLNDISHSIDAHPGQKTKNRTPAAMNCKYHEFPATCQSFGWSDREIAPVSTFTDPTMSGLTASGY